MTERRTRVLDTLTGTLEIPFIYRLIVMFSSAADGTSKNETAGKIDYSAFDREQMNERAE